MASVSGTLPIITHGRNGYRRGCRCEVCCKQYSEMRRAERTAFPLPKGKPERPPRTCKQKGCITELSSYNPEDKCWAHQQPEPPHTIGQWAGPIYSLCPGCQRIVGKAGCRRCVASEAS